MNFMPPAASKIAAHPTTAIIINITSTGADAGGILKTKTSMIRPMPDTTQSPIPP